MEALQEPALLKMAIALTLGGFIIVFALVLVFVLKQAASPWVEILVAVGVAIPFLALSYVMSESTELLMRGLNASDPSEKATNLAQAISSIVHGGAAIAMNWPLALAVVTLGVSAVRRAKHAGRPIRTPIVVTVGCGAFVGALSLSVWLYISELTSAFAAVAMADPAEKGNLLKRAMELAHTDLVSGITVTMLLGGIVAVVAFVSALRTPSTEAGARGWICIALCLAGAAVVAVPAVRFAQESWAPKLPFSPVGELFSEIDWVKPPSIWGPDKTERAPIVMVAPGRLALEGEPVTVEELAQKIQNIRKVDEMMAPGRPFDGRIILVVDRRTTGKEIRRVFPVLRQVGYVNGCLGFRRTKLLHRPLLGQLEASGCSCANFSLNPAAEGVPEVELAEVQRATSDVVRVRLPDDESYASIAKAMVALREKSIRVFISDG